MNQHQRIVDALRAAIVGARLNRVPLDTLRRAAHQADPTLNAHPEARQRLRRAIDALAADGTITTPKGQAGWDTRAEPHLPTWIQRSTPTATAAPADPQLWSDALAPFAARADARQRPVLKQIQRWRSANPHPVGAPYNERSLEVFGDEKRLAEMLKWQLFAGRLPELLATYPVPLPFPSIHVAGKGPTGLLVVENVTTWHSILAALRSRPAAERPDLHIGWGNGAQIEHAIGSVALLNPLPERIAYFGDLDIAGLRIAIAADNAARARHLPTVQPAAALYEALLASSHRRPDLSARGTPDIAQLCGWLPEPIRAAACVVLGAGERIPQESVGLKELTTRPELLDA